MSRLPLSEEVDKTYIKYIFEPVKIENTLGINLLGKVKSGDMHLFNILRVGHGCINACLSTIEQTLDMETFTFTIREHIHKSTPKKESVKIKDLQ